MGPSKGVQAGRTKGGRDLNNGNSGYERLLEFVGLVGVVALGAAAQGSSGSQQMAKETECNSQADARDFWHSRI